MTALGRAIALFGVVNALAALCSIDWAMSLLGPHAHQFYGLLPLSLCALAFFAAAALDDIPSAVLTRMAAVGAGGAGVWACLQMAGLDRTFGWSIQDGRAGGTFGSPIFLGAFLSFAAPLAWRRARQGRQRMDSAVLLAVLAGLACTRSRGAGVAAAAGILAYEALERRLPARALGISGILAAMGLAALCGHEGSDLGRLEVWRTALEIGRAYPLLGTGPDTFPLAFRHHMTARFAAAAGNDFTIELSAHNDLLQALATLGLIGLAAYLLVLWRAAAAVWRALPRDPEAAAIGGALFAAFIQAKVNPIPLAVTAAIAVLLGALDRDPEPDPNLRRGFAAAGLAAALLCAAAVWRECRAERWQHLGELARERGRVLEAAQDFNLAAQQNPLDFYYTQRQLDFLRGVAPAFDAGGQARLLRAHQILAERATRLHPNDPSAHESRALCYVFEAAVTGRDLRREEEAELAVAERLAPTFGLYARWRAELAAVLAGKRRREG